LLVLDGGLDAIGRALIGRLRLKKSVFLFLKEFLCVELNVRLV
jgi:hypothetical protein